MKNNNIWRNTSCYIIVLGFYGSKYMFDNISLGCIGIISYLSGSIKCTSPTLLITRIIACILINTVITCRDWVKSATFTNCSWLIAAAVLTLTLYYWAIIIETRDNKAASAHPSIALYSQNFCTWESGTLMGLIEEHYTQPNALAAGRIIKFVQKF